MRYSLFLLLSGLLSWPAIATDINALATHTTWLRLLHYPALHSSSSINNQDFFLAKTGRHDPLAELRATINALQQPVVEPANNHAACRFPARRAFLARHVALNIPNISCPDYQAFYQREKISGATLIFAEGFLDNPASVFGHLFLRLNRAERHEHLLDPTLNFTADMHDNSMLKQIAKGLLGGYVGRFHALQFYAMVNSHNRAEDRGFWEYPLILTPPQRKRLLDHYWEIRHANFNYYFMSDNCVTQVLALLEAAVPNLNLLANSGHRIMPLQVFTALHNNNLLGKPTYRPALSNQIRQREALVPASLIPTITQLATIGLTADNRAQLAQHPMLIQARALDLAIDLLDHQQGKQATKTALLTARSAINLASQWPVSAMPAQQPIFAHGASRGTVGITYAQNTWSPSIGARFMYYDELDPNGANPWGTAVEVFDILGRYQHNQWRLERLTLLNLSGIYPHSGLLKPWSFSTKVGFRRHTIKHGTLAYAQTGRGLAWGNQRYLTYVLANGIINAGKTLDKGWQLAAGITAGLLFQPQQRWTIKAEMAADVGVLGDHASTASWSIQQQWSFNQSLGLRLSISDENWLKHPHISSTLALHAYW